MQINEQKHISKRRRFGINSGDISIFVLAVFSTALAPFIADGQRNLLVIAVSILLPFIFFLFRLRPRRDLFWAGLFSTYILLMSILRGVASDINSTIYTILFLVAYLCIAGSLIKGKIERSKMTFFLKYLILAYAVLSVAQFLAIYYDLPVPNDILSRGLLGHNSLAVEPSHLARALSISMFTYLVLRRTDKDNFQFGYKLLLREWVVVGSFLVSIVLSGSSLAAFLAPLSLTPLLNKRWFFVFISLGILFVPVLENLEIKVLQRLFQFLIILPSLDIDSLAGADHSGAVRIMPLLYFLNQFDYVNLVFWFGVGPGATTEIFAGNLPGVPDDFASGFLPGFILSFGIIGFALMVYAFIFRLFHIKTLPLILFWCLIFFASPWNTQLFWYGLMLIRAVYWYEVESKIMNTSNHQGIV